MARVKPLRGKVKKNSGSSAGSVMKGILISLWNCLKRYLENSNVHGFKYLVEADRHWTEKLFWIIACGVSFWACGSMVIKTIEFATAQDVSITVETSYLNWTARMPAMHFCVSWSKRGLPAGERVFSKVFFDYSTLGADRSLKIELGEDVIGRVKSLIQPQVQDLFGICKFNDEKFDCNKAFFNLSSNAGECLSFNSYQAGQPAAGLPTFNMNHRRQRAKLSIIMNETSYLKDARKNNLKFFLVNGFDYPAMTTNKEKEFIFKWEKKLAVIDVTTIPMYVDKRVMEMDMAMRKCRLSTENKGNLFMKYYNYDGCLAETQMKNMYKLLGCVSHIFPRVKKMRLCNQTELTTAVKLSSQIKNISGAECLPDCEGEIYDYNFNVYNYDDRLPEWSPLQIDINMLPGPGLRYYTYPTRSILQTIVSVGSVVGLFMGASLLSIIEIIYWLLLRKIP